MGAFLRKSAQSLGYNWLNSKMFASTWEALSWVPNIKIYLYLVFPEDRTMNLTHFGWDYRLKVWGESGYIIKAINKQILWMVPLGISFRATYLILVYLWIDDCYCSFVIMNYLRLVKWWCIRDYRIRCRHFGSISFQGSLQWLRGWW